MSFLRDRFASWSRGRECSPRQFRGWRKWIRDSSSRRTAINRRTPAKVLRRLRFSAGEDDEFTPVNLDKRQKKTDGTEVKPHSTGFPDEGTVPGTKNALSQRNKVAARFSPSGGRSPSSSLCSSGAAGSFERKEDGACRGHLAKLLTILTRMADIFSIDCTGTYSYLPWKLCPPMHIFGHGIPRKERTVPSVPPRMGV